MHFFISLLLYLLSTPLLAEVHGKFDVGAALLDVDIINSGSTIKGLDMRGGSANGTLVFYKGFCIKPSAAIVDGNGNYHQLGTSLGFVFPIKDKVYITPSAGALYSRLRLLIDIPAYMLTNVTEKFRTWTKTASVDGAVVISPKFMLSGTFQYGWSSIRTTIGSLISTKTASRGINWSTMLDYYLNDHWSINLAIAGQKSQSKEKDGNKAMAFRLGIGYTI